MRSNNFLIECAIFRETEHLDLVTRNGFYENTDLIMAHLQLLSENCVISSSRYIKERIYLALLSKT